MVVITVEKARCFHGGKLSQYTVEVDVTLGERTLILFLVFVESSCSFAGLILEVDILDHAAFLVRVVRVGLPVARLSLSLSLILRPLLLVLHTRIFTLWLTH